MNHISGFDGENAGVMELNAVPELSRCSSGYADDAPLTWPHSHGILYTPKDRTLHNN